MDATKVGARIAKLRNEMNITQLELAEKLGVTDRAVSKWETGIGYPDVTLLPQIADVFGVSIDYLLRGKSVTVHKIKNLNPWDNRHFDLLNTEYLSNGWLVKDVQMAGDGDGGVCGVVVLEKEICDE